MADYWGQVIAIIVTVALSEYLLFVQVIESTLTRQTAALLGSAAVFGSTAWIAISLRGAVGPQQRRFAITGPLGLVQMFAGALLLSWSVGAPYSLLVVLGAGMFISYVIWNVILIRRRSS